MSTFQLLNECFFVPARLTASTAKRKVDNIYKKRIKIYRCMHHRFDFSILHSHRILQIKYIRFIYYQRTKKIMFGCPQWFVFINSHSRIIVESNKLRGLDLFFTHFGAAL